MHSLPHTRSCFVCGSANLSGLRLRFETDGRVVRSEFIPGPEHVGFKQVVHGGILSTVLDEILVWACAVQTRRFAYCAELNVRFLRPARPGEPLTATGELVADRKGRIFEARGELRNRENELCAVATGKYLPIPESETTGMLEELTGPMPTLPP